MAHGDGVRRLTVGEPQFRYVPRTGASRSTGPLIDQLHDRQRGEGLRRRADHERCPGRDPAAVPGVSHTAREDAPSRCTTTKAAPGTAEAAIRSRNTCSTAPAAGTAPTAAEVGHLRGAGRCAGGAEQQHDRRSDDRCRRPTTRTPPMSSPLITGAFRARGRPRADLGSPPGSSFAAPHPQPQPTEVRRAAHCHWRLTGADWVPPTRWPPTIRAAPAPFPAAARSARRYRHW